MEIAFLSIIQTRTNRPTTFTLTNHVKKLEATLASDLVYDLLRISAPHSGQSSQLLFDANARSAQFPATSAGAP